MDGRNMVGLTEQEIREYAGRPCYSAVFAVLCALVLAMLGAGWTVYLACLRWPAVGYVSQAFGVALAFALTVALIKRRA